MFLGVFGFAGVILGVISFFCLVVLVFSSIFSGVFLVKDLDLGMICFVRRFWSS